MDHGGMLCSFGSRANGTDMITVDVLQLQCELFFAPCIPSQDP